MDELAHERWRKSERSTKPLCDLLVAGRRLLDLLRPRPLRQADPGCAAGELADLIDRELPRQLLKEPVRFRRSLPSGLSRRSFSTCRSTDLLTTPAWSPQCARSE